MTKNTTGNQLGRMEKTKVTTQKEKKKKKGKSSGSDIIVRLPEDKKSKVQKCLPWEKCADMNKKTLPNKTCPTNVATKKQKSIPEKKWRLKLEVLE